MRSIRETLPNILRAKANKERNRAFRKEELQQEANSLGISVVDLRRRKFREVLEMRRRQDIISVKTPPKPSMWY